MQIEFLPNLLRIHFQHPLVQTLQYEPDGYLTVINSQGQIASRFKTVACVPYSAQYGTPISKDGYLLFISTWKGGLFCYSIQEQKLVWKAGPGRVKNILVSEHALLVQMAGRGIYRRDLYTGELVEIIKLPSIDTFKQLNPNQLFAGPLKGAYWLFDLPSMRPMKRVKTRDLNVNNCLSYVVQDVYYQDQILLVKGFERYREGNYEDEETTEFERPITLT